VFVEEFQTAPDSLERIELYPQLDREFPFELGGAQIITNAGTAIIDSGVRFETETSLVVVDRSNTSGTFSLGDDSDYIRLYVPDVYDTFRLRYPDNPHWTYEGSWAPPAGTSASLCVWGVWVPPGDLVDFYTWYVDETPTFGADNDDNQGGIWGHVLDQDSQPIVGATVRMASAYGTAAMQTENEWIFGRGYFEERPTGPGTFTVTAECPGYLPGAYPDPIVLAPNEVRQIAIMLDCVGIAEEAAGKANLVGLHQLGRMLVLTADRAGTAVVTVCDNLGRVRMSEEVAVVAGSKDVPLPGLQSGVYFARCQFGERRLRTKLVLY
jgi:hypothetical protein